VLGKLWFSVPHLGAWRSGVVWVALAAVALGVVGLIVLVRGGRRARGRRSDNEPHASPLPPELTSVEGRKLESEPLAGPEQVDATPAPTGSALRTGPEVDVVTPEIQATFGIVAEPDQPVATPTPVEAEVRVTEALVTADVFARSRDGSRFRRQRSPSKDRSI
ncbi:MAG: hypothetical protein ACRD1G_18485, partial [Acidimicrobiales bacterium]